MTTRLPWRIYEAQISRLSYLAGADRVQEQHHADAYTILSGYFPGELARAVSGYLAAPDAQFYPTPGQLKARMDAHRRGVGGNNWDSTLAALEAEERGQEPPKLAPRVDFDERIPLLTRAQEEASR